MSFEQIKKVCQQGYYGHIPNWEGYLKWNYADNTLQFVNGNYVMREEELVNKLNNRTDLYYII